MKRLLMGFDVGSEPFKFVSLSRGSSYANKTRTEINTGLLRKIYGNQGTHVPVSRLPQSMKMRVKLLRVSQLRIGNYTSTSKVS